MSYLGDFKAGATVTKPFVTSAATGAAVAPSSAFEAADVRVYKNASATQRSSAAGITMTSPFDSITGGHMLAIDLSDDTDAGFYAAGNDYHVMLVPDETVDSVAVVAVLFSFSIQNRGGIFSRQMTELYAADGVVPTPEQALLMILQKLTDESVSGTTGTIRKRDGSTTAFTVTYNHAVNPTAVTQAT